MITKEKVNTDTIFVDCFNTIIFRKIKNNMVFKNWAKELSVIYRINWKIFYKTYKQTNFKMCFTKLFTSLTLQENIDNVLNKMYFKLNKKYKFIEYNNFISTAKEIYMKKELECFYVNTDLINFLKSEKLNGKKIYLVSDFYCKSDVFKFWFSNLNILDVFDEIFSSADFNKEKATTKIYKYLLKTLNLNPKQVTMYGDNIWSDIMMAKLSGLQAKRIKVKQRRNYEEN